MAHVAHYIASSPEQAIPLRPNERQAPCGRTLHSAALVCTREVDHDGPHVAHGFIDGEPVAWAIWEERLLRCSQCGQPYASRACGPTHAMIAHEGTLAS